MPIVGFRFRAYTDGQTLRALKALGSGLRDLQHPTMSRHVLLP